MKYAAMLIVLLGVLIVPAQAADEISYTSQPDAVYVFLNNIALARETLTLPGEVDVNIVLPNSVFIDTLVIRENGARVPTYQVRRDNNLISIGWQSMLEADVREVTLDYLLSGLNWKPKYDMWVQSTEQVAFDFFVEFTNNALVLEDVELQLIAGRVDAATQVDDISRITSNQYLAGYEQDAVDGNATVSGVARIQHVYDVGRIDSQPGAIVYTQLQTSELPARRLLLWNAQTDREVTVIYKVRNATDLPFAEGIVRSYQDGLFLGSDFIERTPLGSEGSVTVGTLPDVRVNRTETQRSLDGPSDRDDLHIIEMTLENFGTEAVEIEVVDRYPANALELKFSAEPADEGGNLFRWLVTIEPGESRDIRYEYKN